MSQESKLDFIEKGVSDLRLELGERSRNSSSSEQVQLGRSPVQVLHAPQLEWHEKHLADLLTAEHDIRQEQSILASLDFQSRPVRYESIQEACASTFEWTFNNSDFARWAKSECGVFWIAGKAGSGKSTLMKHITDHDSTRDMLSSWAYPKLAIIATHYFWAAGTAIQKSHQGLLQSILYDIFRECPACIPIACPARWSKKGQQNSTWSMTELSTSLNKLAKEDDLPTKFCFFIDGLDEFGDDHLELCEVIRDLSRSPHIKLCVSSRPLNVFTKNFGEDQCVKELIKLINLINYQIMIN
jgi:NACHT domain